MGIITRLQVAHCAKLPMLEIMITITLGVEEIVVTMKRIVPAKWMVCWKLVIISSKPLYVLWLLTYYLLDDLNFSILDDYMKVDHSHCTSGKGYENLNYAKLACSSTAKCIGILDESCDNSSTYYLCQEDMMIDGEFESCVHKKRETMGMFRYKSNRCP